MRGCVLLLYFGHYDNVDFQTVKIFRIEACYMHKIHVVNLKKNQKCSSGQGDHHVPRCLKPTSALLS